MVSPWRPLSDLTDGSPALGERYEQTRTALLAGAPDVAIRIAASVGHLGLVARLLCPVVGAAVLGYRLDLTGLWWQPTLGVMPLSVPSGALTPGTAGPTPGRAGPDTVLALLTGPVEALTRRTEAFSLSRKILDGNVSSALNGAVMAISRARPDLSRTALRWARRAGFDAGPTFRRRSCCLIYQLSAPEYPSYCGDCVLPAGR